MQILDNKSYFTRMNFKAFEFGPKESRGEGHDLRMRNGVHYLGGDNDFYYFQPVLPFYINGEQKDVYIEINNDDLDKSLSESF